MKDPATVQFNMRFTLAEKQELQRLAQQAHLSMSEYIKYKTFLKVIVKEK